MSEAIVEKRKGISPVWILPLLAICLGGWLLFKSYYDAGIDITIHVEDSTGITMNKTPVLYKGNQVGIVKDIYVRKDLQGVDLIVEMEKGTQPYLVEDVQFWVEKVDVKASSITGLETLLSGNYIGVQLGTSATPSRNFIALPKRPPVSSNAPGLHLGLRANALNSLDIGSGIYNKSIEIGSVQKYELQDDDTVLISIYIEPEYKHLIKTGTRFLNASGITISGGITDLNIHVASFASILKGGIELKTPKDQADTPLAENGQVFTLYTNMKELAKVNFPTGLNIILETDNLDSLKIGSQVYYRGVTVGEVTGFQLSPTFQHVLVNVTIYEPYMPVIRENTKFWNASGISVTGGVLSGLSVSTESMESLMQGGVALATPNNDEMGSAVSNGHSFILQAQRDESWSEWSPKIGSEENKSEKKDEQDKI